MSLEVFCGCQASGKTQSNIKESTKFLDVLEIKGLFINSTEDERDLENIVSSNSSSYKGLSNKFDVIKVKTLKEVLDIVDISKYGIISIDEIQFFEDLVEFVTLQLINGKHIICSGLDSDWKGQDFGNVKELLKISTYFTKVSAKCSVCRKEMDTYDIRKIPDACRTGKISGSDDKIIESGGSKMYEPMCLKHHREHLILIHGLNPDTLEKI